jgi:RNA polymerase sigma-70 factor (ECF subfamily)
LINLAQVFHLNISTPKSDSPEAKFAQSRAEDALISALGALKPQLREAVVLRYGHGLTYREIADVMNCPPKTAESRVRLAHDKLRGLLQPVGHGLLDELLSF